jgi:hypothetical protein
MATLKAGKWTYTDQQLDRMLKEADKRGQERLKNEPRAARAEYDAGSRRLIIELLNGCVLIVPVDLMQGLRGASDRKLADFKLMPRGFDLHWKQLDAQFTVAGLLAGKLGTKAWMAKLEGAENQAVSRIRKTAATASANIAANGRSRTSTAEKPNRRRRRAA